MPTRDEAEKWYANADPVHGFDHVLRVLEMAARIGREYNADLEILEAAALLHDAAGASPESEEGTGGRGAHEQASAEFARQTLQAEGWAPERIEAVCHCIRTHRYRSREAPETLEARVLFDADKLDVLGAFGVARTIAYAALADQPSYAEPSEGFLRSGEREPGEPHSAYHEYLFKLRKVRDRLYTPQARAIADRRQVLLDRFFQQLASEAEGRA